MLKVWQSTTGTAVELPYQPGRLGDCTADNEAPPTAARDILQTAATVNAWQRHCVTTALQ